MDSRSEPLDLCMFNTLVPHLRTQTDERPTPLERPFDNINLSIKLFSATLDEGHPS